MSTKLVRARIIRSDRNSRLMPAIIVLAFEPGRQNLPAAKSRTPSSPRHRTPNSLDRARRFHKPLGIENAGTAFSRTDRRDHFYPLVLDRRGTTIRALPVPG